MRLFSEEAKPLWALVREQLRARPQLSLLWVGSRMFW